MSEVKYTTASVREYGKNGWIASIQYIDGKSAQPGSGSTGGKTVWKTLRRVLKATGRDKGRSTRARNAALMEAEELRNRLNEEHRLEQERRAAGIVPGETVADYLTSYIEGKAPHIERSTAAEYRRLLDKLIAPTIGGMELDALNPDAVQSWMNEAGRKYSAQTVKKAFILLRSAMAQAVERDRLPKNPTRTVKPPKLEGPKPNALDERGRAKVAQFIAIDPSSRTNIGFAMALYMGMREGEICGLRWKNVDLDAGTLSIEETIGHEGSKWYLKPPKTGGSRRTLYIPDNLIAALKERRALMNEERMTVGTDLPSLFVVGSADGSFMQPHYLSTKWRKTADVLSLVGTEGKRPTFHDLRHTCATAAIAHGVDVKTVSSMLGHANAAMTLNTYASADPDARKRGAETVANALEAEALRHANDGQVIEFGKTGTDGV